MFPSTAMRIAFDAHRCAVEYLSASMVRDLVSVACLVRHDLQICCCKNDDRCTASILHFIESAVSPVAILAMRLGRRL